VAEAAPGRAKYRSRQELSEHVRALRAQMLEAARNLDFELAARIRDEVFRVEALELEIT
jgi:excinuclease UvrABC helicase subunit UvrB